MGAPVRAWSPEAAIATHERELVRLKAVVAGLEERLAASRAALAENSAQLEAGLWRQLELEERMKEAKHG